MKKKEPLLPIAKKVYAKTLGEDLMPSAPMTIEELAKGREIKTYPYKYDAFDGIDSLIDWIEMELEKGKFKREWLAWSTSEMLPVQISKVYYYTSVKVFRVSAIDPDGNKTFMLNVKTLFELNPLDWNISNVEAALKAIRDSK